MSRLPLEGLRVADFSWVVAVPTATQFLAEQGAEVIRFESTRHMDMVRGLHPFADGIQDIESTGHYHVHNLNKKGITVDLSQSRGRELALELVKISDVVTENFAAGVMDRLGLGYDELKRVNPGVVFLSNSALGRTGPHRNYVAVGIVLMAVTGLTSVTGHVGRPPGITEPYWADYVAGMYAYYAILAALYHRRRTGQGQYIDQSMTEAQASFLPEGILEYTMRGRVVEKIGNRDPLFAPQNCYRCEGNDAWVAIGVESDDEWRALGRALGNPAWCHEERFDDPLQRLEHQDELDAHITAWTRQRIPQEAAETLRKEGVPAGPSLNPAELLADPHLEARETFVLPDHPFAGPRAHPGLPWKMSHHPDIQYGSAPLLGQYNQYVFCDLLGLSEGELIQLQESKVLS